MKPAMVDEEVHTRDSDGRSYSGSMKNVGEHFSFLSMNNGQEQERW